MRDALVTYRHQVGTCRMGTDDGAVVDLTRFAVHGLTGIRVADASIMPQVTTANTHAPAVLIAGRAAAQLISEVTLLAAVATAH